jgi:uncharacterized protein YbaR (Trm112 family)
MPIDPDFLSKLICPRTRKPLQPLSEAELGQWNHAIAAGGVRTRAGNPVREALSAALAPAGEAFCYRVDDDIPILLVDEALERGEPTGSA